MAMDTIYVRLLNQGEGALRPVQATRRAGELFMIMSKNDDPETEDWQFPSGSLVRCEPRVLLDVPQLVAVELMPTPVLRLVK